MLTPHRIMFWISLASICLLLVPIITGFAQGKAENNPANTFARLDVDHDGKLLRQEVPARDTQAFERLDRDYDGVISLAEFQTGIRSHAFLSVNETPPDTGIPQLSFRWTSDWAPGDKDAAGHFMGGTETMNIVAHQGKLFAGIGFWTDTPYRKDKTTGPWTGAQVMVKDGPNAPWRVDVTFGANYLRTEALASVTVTTDGRGKALDPPVTLLLAGPSDVTLDTARTACAWVRDDQQGTWVDSPIATMARKAGVRSFGAHIDAMTGIDAVYAGTSSGAIYRAVFDRAAPGQLKWNRRPELAGMGRVMAFAECNGTLYACAGLRKDAQGMVHGGLFRRVDGAHPRWGCVYQWAYTEVEKGDEANLMRGLTAVPAPDGDGQVLLATRANPGVVECIDPHRQYKVTTELDIKSFFGNVFGKQTYTGPALSAYNAIIPWTDPLTGETLYLLGVWVNHPNRAAHRGAWLLARRHNGDYLFGEIADPTRPATGRGLRSTRAIAVSPFPTEPGALYAGGYDCAGQESHNTAWIYRGVLPTHKNN